LKDTIKQVDKDVKIKQKSIKHTKEYKVWEKMYGRRMNLNAPAQLGNAIFEGCGYKRNPYMGQTNSEGAFEHIKDKSKFIQDYFEIKKLDLTARKFLNNVKRELVGQYLRPDFGLLFTESYRSSCRNPNLQNFPVRIKWLSELIRSIIIPRKNHVLLEVDYSAQEVRVSCCYHKDPVLIKDTVGGGDLHKRRAMQLYKLTEEELGSIDVNPGKNIRYCGKNKFVFPGFYGSYHKLMAPDLWEAIAQMHLETAQGVSLFKHLRKHGIKSLGDCDPKEEAIKGTFEYHVKEVEQHQWEQEFVVYNQWKKDWWEYYLKHGGINTLTGFRQYGVFRRNQILCDAIQGSAFHCLLYGLITLQEEMMEKNMKSLIVNEVHDSLLFDAHKSEVDDLIELVQKHLIKGVAKHWKWIIVPLQVEFEIAENDWFHKEKLKVAT
jgi:DNA polymerase-1